MMEKFMTVLIGGGFIYVSAVLVSHWASQGAPGAWLFTGVVLGVAGVATLMGA